MSKKIIDRILQLGEANELSTSLVRHANKPHFNEVKRVLRMVKRIPNQEKPKKLGFYFQQLRTISGGSKQEKEELIRTLLGKSQQIAPNKLIEKIYSYVSDNYPRGEYVLLKPETSYQTAQRLIPDAKINRTLSASVYGDILAKELKKFLEKHPDFDELYRTVHSFSTQGHFTSAAAFVRYTLMSPDWIHFDAYQTDYFNKLRRYLHNNSSGMDKVIEEFITTIESKEFEFYKTAVSYVVRSHPKVNIFTSSTVETVKRVEDVKGEGKLNQLYRELPKDLGFKLITLDRLTKIFATRPGTQETEKRKLLDKGFRIKNGSPIKEEVIKKTLTTIKTGLIKHVKEDKPLFKKSGLDNFVKRVIDELHTSSVLPNDRERMKLAFHQILDPMFEAHTSKDIDRIEEFFKNEKHLNKIKETLEAKVSGTEDSIWWANRTTIFEEKETEFDAIMRIINS